MSDWNQRTSTEYKTCLKKSGSSAPPTARNLCGIGGNGTMTGGEAMVLKCPNGNCGWEATRPEEAIWTETDAFCPVCGRRMMDVEG